jgi:hypothetical protein
MLGIKILPKLKEVLSFAQIYSRAERPYVFPLCFYTFDSDFTFHITPAAPSTMFCTQ